MQFFQRKFTETSVVKIYIKMWKLWVHLDYDHLYIQLTSKLGKFLSQTNIFQGNSNPFSIKPTVARVKISEKCIIISGLKFPYHRLANRKKLILPLEEYFKTLKDIFESFTIFQSG